MDDFVICDLYHINWFTVYVHTPEMMYHYGLSHESLLYLRELWVGHEKDCFWKVLQ